MEYEEINSFALDTLNDPDDFPGDEEVEPGEEEETKEEGGEETDPDLDPDLDLEE